MYTETMKYFKLAEVPGVARGKKKNWNIFLNKKIWKKISIFLSYDTGGPLMCVHKKFQPNRFRRVGRLYATYIYMNVLS